MADPTTTVLLWDLAVLPITLPHTYLDELLHTWAQECGDVHQLNWA
jgi:hypothetical protein